MYDALAGTPIYYLLLHVSFVVVVVDCVGDFSFLYKLGFLLADISVLNSVVYTCRKYYY